jgi:hypothetical protein
VTVPDDPTTGAVGAAGESPEGGDAAMTVPATATEAGGGGTASAGDGVPRSARVFVSVLLALLLVPGVIGFDAWPLTGWRLFSVSRDADQTRWVIQATAADGTSQVVSLEELPLRYRHAEWPMAELPGASDGRRRAVCRALLAPVLDVEPDTAELTIARDHARLVHRGDEWVTEHHLEPFHTCAAGERDGDGRAS